MYKMCVTVNLCLSLSDLRLLRSSPQSWSQQPFLWQQMTTIFRGSVTGPVHLVCGGVRGREGGHTKNFTIVWLD